MEQRKLTPAQWRQVKQTFQAAIELEANQRVAFLAEACAEDAIVRAEVESLLVAHERPGGFMEEPVCELATEPATACQGEGLVSQALGHYQLVRLLGRGGMGEVYLAQDTRLKRKVALKLLPAAFTQDAERVRHFEQEARAASALNHPNIITIHEIGEIEQTHYLVTEFVAGETLRQRLTRGRMEVPGALK